MKRMTYQDYLYNNSLDKSCYQLIYSIGCIDPVAAVVNSNGFRDGERENIIFDTIEFNKTNLGSFKFHPQKKNNHPLTSIFK